MFLTNKDMLDLVELLAHRLDPLKTFEHGLGLIDVRLCLLLPAVRPVK